MHGKNVINYECNDEMCEIIRNIPKMQRTYWNP